MEYGQVFRFSLKTPKNPQTAHWILTSISISWRCFGIFRPNEVIRILKVALASKHFLWKQKDALHSNKRMSCLMASHHSQQKEQTKNRSLFLINRITDRQELREKMWNSKQEKEKQDHRLSFQKMHSWWTLKLQENSGIGDGYVGNQIFQDTVGFLGGGGKGERDPLLHKTIYLQSGLIVELHYTRTKQKFPPTDCWQWRTCLLYLFRNYQPRMTGKWNEKVRLWYLF